jgi:hypothetical protein
MLSISETLFAVASVGAMFAPALIHKRGLNLGTVARLRIAWIAGLFVFFAFVGEGPVGFVVTLMAAFIFAHFALDCLRAVQLNRAVSVYCKQSHPTSWLSGKRLLILVNPNAGGGTAGKLYSDVVRPMCLHNSVTLCVAWTQRSGHAKEICRSIGIAERRWEGERIDAVVCVSGDGLLHECINGFADAFDALPERNSLLRSFLADLPLGVVPAGSANGVAASLYGRSNATPFGATSSILAGRPHPIDMLCVLPVRGSVPRSLDGPTAASPMYTPIYGKLI